MALPPAFSRLPTLRPRALRLLQTAAAPAVPAAAVPNSTEKHYVRIAGPSSYASKQDIALFLQQHTSTPPSPPLLRQGQSDVFQNHSVWLYDAGTQPDAERLASRISGKVVGLKLIRAVAVDQRIVDGMTAPPPAGQVRNATLRKRLNIIAPTAAESGRALLATNLPHLMQPRYLWTFFAAYEVVAVRHLRKSGVACIVFSSAEEATRALRERANFTLQGEHLIGLKMHD